MFIDLVGYTGLSEELDPEDLLGLQRRYQQLALTVMERYGGFVGNFSGDGILVYFGYPTARGNDAERALRAALEMIERLKGVDYTLPDGQVRRLEARIGVHTGLVVVGPELMSSGESSHAAVGEAVNLAARLQLEAPTGGVVVSRETHSLVVGLFDIAPLGERVIKGLSRPVETFRVIRALPATKPDHARLLRSAARMVGREAELARMLSCWKTVREQSRRQVILVVGDAGLGKTRLVNEFCLHPALGNIAMLQTHCHEIFANTALYPVGSFIWKRAGLALEEDERTRRQKLGALLDELGLTSAENRRIIASFPGLTATRAVESIAPTPLLFKRKQYDFILSVFDRVTRSQPTLLWVEDVHWMDPSSSFCSRPGPSPGDPRSRIPTTSSISSNLGRRIAWSSQRPFQAPKTCPMPTCCARRRRPKAYRYS